MAINIDPRQDNPPARKNHSNYDWTDQEILTMIVNQESAKYDAILLAGEGESSYKVLHQHKAFLRIKDKCLINYVIEAVQKVESVRDIYIVGSRAKLITTMEECGIDRQYPKKIYVLEQKANLYENIWHAFLQTLPEQISESELENSKYRDKAVLIAPCDAPLITPYELEYFISESDLENYDHIIGLTPADCLRHFHPRDGKPGIEMAYLHLKENIYRANNLHMVKPIRIKNREYIREIYQYRYQRNIKNFLLFGLSLYRNHQTSDLKYYFSLQLSLMFSKLGMESAVNFFRGWAPIKGLRQCVSHILRTRVWGLEMPFPGAALDIDNEHDYHAILQRFDEWTEYLAQLDKPQSLTLVK